MLIPKQSLPIRREVSTAKISDVMAGVNPSNWQLQCDLCCANGGGAYCNVVLPGCSCSL